MNHIFRNIISLIAILCSGMAMAQIEVHPLPEKDGPHPSHLYQVQVRPLSGGEWQQVPVLRCDVNTRKVQQAAYAEFDMGSPVVVQVTRNAEDPMAQSVIRPSSRQITLRQVGPQTVEFTLPSPDFFSLEFNGDRFHNLHLFANPILTERHTADEPNTINWEGIQSQDVFIRDPQLIYFGPGVHKPKDLPSGDIKIPSNCTVYLAPGAIVKARLIVDRAENVRIIGRGIVDHPLRGVEITYSKNVLVEGITFLNPSHYTIFGGQSEDIVIRGIKSFSARSWSDGVDLMCCRRVLVENCFLRTSDDCIALYNHRWWYWGGSGDIEVTRCSFWPDVAHPVNIGSHGDDRNPDGETLRNVRIHDCDILCNNEEGMLAINCGDNNHIRNVTFENIRAEGISKGRLFDMRVLHSEKYNRAPGCCIDSITFRNIYVSEPSASLLRPSRIWDFDKEHGVRTYTLGNIRLGDRMFDEQKDVERYMEHP